MHFVDQHVAVRSRSNALVSVTLETLLLKLVGHARHASRHLHHTSPFDSDIHAFFTALQESMVSNPPRCCGLGLIHAVAPSDHESTGRAQNFHESSAVTDAGVAYIHTPVSLQTMQTVVAVVVGMLEVPAAVMRAPGMCSPYVEFRCLASDVGGGGVMKSRRSLQRVGQAS